MMLEHEVSRATRVTYVCHRRQAVVKRPLRTARMFRLGRGPPRVVYPSRRERVAEAGMYGSVWT